MAVKTIIKPSEYHDSVSLMLVAQELSHLPGVTDAAVVMATEANKGILQQAELLTSEAAAASANDLVIAVSGDESALVAALAEVDRLLTKKGPADGQAEFRPRSLRSAVKTSSSANVAVISVSGRYAAGEAWEALQQCLHVLLFSDNVSLEDEIRLKQYAAQRGLLLMGPGAGTAILNHVALGFANVIPPGPVGIVSAAGTGLQEVSTLLAKNGSGITQGIGTGGRDLKEEVGGIMMLAGLEALQEDPATEVIVLVSKPPAESVARKVLAQVSQSDKPTVVCFLGAKTDRSPNGERRRVAHTLEEAALIAAELAGSRNMLAQLSGDDLETLADSSRRCLRPEQRYLRGLFSGGTLCYEAQVIWRDILPELVLSNAPLDSEQQLPDSNLSQGHTAVDLGEEEFTVGRLHPMIDNDLRVRRLMQEAADPHVAAILLDVVIGYGAHQDPASELAHAVRNARRQAADSGREVAFVASVTGTEADPQRLSRQVRTLEEAGVTVCQSNATAARLVAKIIER